MANIIACRPGTAIIEFLLHGSQLNLCYMFLAVKLGLKYHAYSNPGIKFKNKPMEVEVDKIIQIAKTLLMISPDN